MHLISIKRGTDCVPVSSLCPNFPHTQTSSPLLGDTMVAFSLWWGCGCAAPSAAIADSSR